MSKTMGILVGVWLSKLDFGLCLLRGSETWNNCSGILLGLMLEMETDGIEGEYLRHPVS